MEIDEGRVVRVGIAPAGPSGTAAPLFCDLQVNGYAGVDLQDPPDADLLTRADAALLTDGVGTWLPTLISAPIDDLTARVQTWAEMLRTVASAEVAERVPGLHLEGPFLSDQWPGAHPPGTLGIRT